MNGKKAFCLAFYSTEIGQKKILNQYIREVGRSLSICLISLFRDLDDTIKTTPYNFTMTTTWQSPGLYKSKYLIFYREVFNQNN
jgi:hypothetical protein